MRCFVLLLILCSTLYADATRSFVYTNNLKNWNFGKEAAQNSRLERATIAQEQGLSVDANFERQSTTPKTNSSGCLCIELPNRFFEKGIKPYWIKKEKSHFQVLEIKPVEKQSEKQKSKVEHLILAARKALEMPWDYLLFQDLYRLGIKFGRPFNVVFDPVRFEKRVEDTAVFLEETLPPGQIPFPGILLGVRFDF